MSSEYWIDDDGYIAHGKGDDYETVSGCIDLAHIDLLARIIESQPELLEACKTVNEDISRFRSTYVRPVTLEKIRQAIAKAEGGE